MLERVRAYDLDLLVPARDEAIGASLRDHGEFARPEVDLICDYLAAAGEPATFLDVGANIGAIALPVAARRPGCRVIAYEAARSLSGVLAANALNNRLYNVEVTHAAAGPAPGLLRFPKIVLDGAGNFGGVGLDQADRHPTEWVRGCVLDAEAPDDVRFVKIDVEGHELPVLRGAERLLAERKPVWLIEVNRDRQRSDAVFQFLTAAGYRLFWFFAPFVTAAPLRGEPPAKPVGDHNWLALPPGAPNLWDLPEHADVDAPRPTSVKAFGYLARYGYAGALA